MTSSATDLAWLAGIVDGEGCFSVKRPIVRQNGKRQGSRTSYQIWLVICNTSKPMMDRISQILADHGVAHKKMRKVWKGVKATRWQWWLEIQRKHELLKVTELLLPHLTAKKDEAHVVVWFLSKACQVKQYHRTPFDQLVLETMSTIKKNGGEAPAEVREFLREVIPSQAVPGDRASVQGTEGVEARAVSSTDNPPQECPAASLN
jgi:hypothetical protein